MLVPFVQGVVGTFHENSRPFDERGGKETGKGADEDFLEEGGVHPFLKATIVPPTEVFQENDVDLALWRNLTNTAL